MNVTGVQTCALPIWLERPVVDRLRLGHLAVRPRQNFLRRGEADANRVEIARQCAAIVKAWSHFSLGNGRSTLRPYTCSSTGSGAASIAFFFVFISSTSRHRLWSSGMRTLNDSGRPAVNDASPLTMAS